MEYDLLDLINSVSTVVIAVIALVSLVWSISLQRKLMRGGFDRIDLSVEPKGCFPYPRMRAASASPSGIYFSLIICLISPSGRRAEITRFALRVYETKFHYYVRGLRKVPIVKRLFTHFKWTDPKGFDEIHPDDLQPLFDRQSVDLEGGVPVTYSKSHKELMDEFSVGVRSVIVFEVEATPDHHEKVRVNGSEIFGD